MSVGAVFVASWPGAHAWKSCQSARERCHAHGSLGSKYRDAAAAGSLRRSYTGWGPCAKGYVRSVYFQGWLRIGIFPNSRPRNSSWRTGLGYVMRGHEQESWISEFRDESCERRRCESWKRIDSRQTCHLFTGFHFSFLHTPFIVQSAIISFTPPLPLSSLHSLQMPVVRPCMLEARDENEKSVFNVWII